MLFNNPEVVSYVSENFVGVASDDVAYNNLPDSSKQKAEFQFLKNALADGERSLHQGVYAVTSSGKFLGKVDGGWPIYDASVALRNLKEANSKYQGLSSSVRLAKQAFTDSDRSLKLKEPETSQAKVKLINFARHYDFAEMEKFDARHPIYAKRDGLWLSVDEERGLLPQSFELGVKSKVSQTVIDRLLLHGHLTMGCPAWWRDHLKKKEMTVSVERVVTGKVYLKYEGDFVMQADSKWNKSGYRGRLLGSACWSVKDNKFESLEWVTLGERDLKELKSNLHRGSTKRTNVAAYLRLANGSTGEQNLRPHKIGEYRW